MTTPLSGAISFGQIAAEFGVACSNISMSNFYRETALGNKCTPYTACSPCNTESIPTTGAISFCHFYCRAAPVGGTCCFFCHTCVGVVPLPAGLWNVAVNAVGGGGGGGGMDGAACGGCGGKGREVCGKGQIVIATCGAVLMYVGLGGNGGTSSASYAAGGAGGTNSLLGGGAGGAGGRAGCTGSSGAGGGGGASTLVSIACCCLGAGSYSSCFYYIGAGGGGGGGGGANCGADCLNTTLLPTNGNSCFRNLGTTTDSTCIVATNGWTGQGEDNIRSSISGTVCNYDGGGGGGGGGGAGASQNWGQLGTYCCCVIKGGYYWYKFYDDRIPEGGGAGFAYHNTAWPVCCVGAWTSCTRSGCTFNQGGIGGLACAVGGTIGIAAVSWCNRVYCTNLPGPSLL